MSISLLEEAAAAYHYTKKNQHHLHQLHHDYHHLSTIVNATAAAMSPTAINSIAQTNTGLEARMGLS